MVLSRTKHLIMSRRAIIRDQWQKVSVFPGNPKGRFRVTCTCEIGSLLGIIQYVSKNKNGVKVWKEECFKDWVDITAAEANDEDIIVWAYWIGEGDTFMMSATGTKINQSETDEDRLIRIAEYSHMFDSFYNQRASELARRRLDSSLTQKQQQKSIGTVSFAVSGEVGYWTHWDAVSLTTEPTDYLIRSWSQKNRSAKARIKYLIDKQPYRKVFEDREFQGEITISPRAEDNVPMYACAASLRNEGADKLFVQATPS